MPQEVKPIFQEFNVGIAGLKPCVVKPNLQCILDAFENDGVKGMKQAVKLSHGTLQKLFQKMLNLDLVVVEQMNALPKSAGQQAVEISNFVFHTKANWIQQYLQQLKV